MIRQMIAGAAAASLLLPLPALADALAVTKTATVISDPLGNAAPKSLPGAVVDYKVQFTNPLANATLPVRAIVVADMLPTNVILRVSDIATAGKGPVEFVDGSVLGSGLLGSGLTCPFVSLASTTDCVEFSNGTSWSYVPVADADGYDANVRAIRLSPGTTFSTGGSFRLRYRVKIR